MKFLASIKWRDPRLTRDCRIWGQYICWIIQFWMMFHKPYYPLRLRGLVYKHWPHARERWSVSWSMVHNWQRINPKWKLTPECTPFPWYIGDAALGPFVKPWDKMRQWFSYRTGNRSHRCEFTDLQRGALYGSKDGGFMDAYFEIFIQEISDES